MLVSFKLVSVNYRICYVFSSSNETIKQLWKDGLLYSFAFSLGF